MRARPRDEGVERTQRDGAEGRRADPIRVADVLIDEEGTGQHAQSFLPEQCHTPPEAGEVRQVVKAPQCAAQEDEFTEVGLVEDHRESARGLPRTCVRGHVWLHGFHSKVCARRQAHLVPTEPE
ncbi:MAG TPA: hypothetical protein VFU74_03020 [Actinocrinis sp.]|nr:hypothetical protein [Actinocrinis sp.]